MGNQEDFYTSDRQIYIDLDYLTQIDTDLGMEVRAFHHSYDYYAIFPDNNNPNITPVDRVLNFDKANSRWWGGEFKLTGTQFKHHKWIAGLEVQYDQLQHLVDYDIKPFHSFVDSNRHGWRAGVYLQDEYRITDNLLINVGLRLDHHHLINSLQLHPRIGLIWDITPAFTAKFLYGSAFRAPNTYERDYAFIGGSKPNANNTEELIKSYEAVAEWYPGQGLKLLGTLFYNDLSKVLQQDPVSLLFVNTGKFHTYGFELAAEKRWGNNRSFKLTWTHNYTRDENLSGGSWAPDSPKNLVKLHYAEPLFNDAVRLGFEEIFVDDRRTLANNIAPSYNLFNIDLAIPKPIYGFQASLGIYNVLDQRYKVLGGSEHVQDTLSMDGRTVRFRLEYGF